MLTMNYVAAPCAEFGDLTPGEAPRSERGSLAAFQASLHRLLAVAILAPHEVPEDYRDFARWNPKEYRRFGDDDHAATFFMLESEAVMEDARCAKALAS